MPSHAVQEAVALLRSRRDEASLEMSVLAHEVAEISAALNSLGVTDAPSPVIFKTVPIPRRGRKGTIRAAVEDMFNAAPETLNMDTLIERLRDEFQGERTDDQFRSTVRTSLWTLRNTGVIVQQGPAGTHIGTKWLPSNAGAPADTGAPDSGESSGDSPLQEGGPDNGSEPPQDRGGDAYLAQLHHDHAGDRASIVEASV